MNDRSRRVHYRLEDRPWDVTHYSEITGVRRYGSRGPSVETGLGNAKYFNVRVYLRDENVSGDVLTFTVKNLMESVRRHHDGSFGYIYFMMGDEQNARKVGPSFAFSSKAMRYRAPVRRDGSTARAMPFLQLAILSMPSYNRYSLNNALENISNWYRHAPESQPRHSMTIRLAGNNLNVQWMLDQINEFGAPNNESVLLSAAALQVWRGGTQQFMNSVFNSTRSHFVLMPVSRIENGVEFDDAVDQGARRSQYSAGDNEVYDGRMVTTFIPQWIALGLPHPLLDNT
jgi:hypothetical protein